MKRALALSAAALVGAAVTLPSVAAAAQKVSYTSVTTKEQETRNGFVIAGKVTRDGKAIGTDRLACTISGDGGKCTYVVTLAGGKIRGTTAVEASSTSGKIVVRGGTGDYFGLVGNGTWKNLNRSGTRTKIVLNLK